jgi:hypothetical protein
MPDSIWWKIVDGGYWCNPCYKKQWYLDHRPPVRRIPMTPEQKKQRRKEVIAKFYRTHKAEIQEYQNDRKDKKREYDKEYRSKISPDKKETRKQYRREHKAEKAKYDQEYRAQGYVRIKDRERSRKKRENNKPLMCFYASQRRSRKLQATPKWLSATQLSTMKDMFLNRPAGYHVDHIVPLKGFRPGTRIHFVCGLNVPWNLQYLPGYINIRKNGKYE